MAPSPIGSHVGSLLVVEDEEPQQRTLTAGFGARGFHVDVAASGRAALDRAEALRPDLAIVDLGLPDMDGLEVCRHLLVRGVCPVIVVTADAVEDRMIAALDMGAADYVVKPFSLDVLAARVRRVLREHDEGAAVGLEPIDCGDVRIDVAAHEVWVAGEQVPLPPAQFALLGVLVRNSGRVLTYQALSRAVHGEDRASASGREALRTSVSALRRRLGTGPDRPVIRTESRVGYRLVPAAEDGSTSGQT